MKYIDREGMITTEDSGQDRLLRWMYTHRAGRLALKVLVLPGVSKAGGWLLDSRCSRVLIKPFVKRQGIDLDLYEGREYASYNDFFTRQIKKEHRPIANKVNPSLVIRYMGFVFPLEALYESK